MKKINSYDELPSILLIIIGLCAAFVASYSGWILGKGTPMFYEAALQAHTLDIKGIIVGLTLAAIFIVFSGFSLTANACRAVIQERHFK